MSFTIDRLVSTFTHAWFGADAEPRLGDRPFTASEQSRNERELAAFVDVLTSEARAARRGSSLRAQAEARLFEAFRRFVVSALGWEAGDIDALLSDGFRPALEAFPVEARRFDPTLALAAIYQAARNAITMHCLQRLLGVPVSTTPAVLAYSLLYPYTDNYLDDRSIDVEEKRRFGSRLAERLAGRILTPLTSHEEQIFRLVGMIEGQFDRRAHPDVFRNLVAIHRAQERSLALLHASPAVSADEIVRLSFEKGGASVLVDGFLVAGALEPAQAECLFGLGIFLQLRDDLEDLEEDRGRGLRTVFSSVEGPLDDPFAQALAIGGAVLERLDCFRAPSAAALRGLMERSLTLALTDAAVASASRFSAACLARLEAHSPFRLDVLSSERRRVSRARGSLTVLLEAWLGEVS